MFSQYFGCTFFPPKATALYLLFSESVHIFSWRVGHRFFFLGFNLGEQKRLFYSVWTFLIWGFDFLYSKLKALHLYAWATFTYSKS